MVVDEDIPFDAYVAQVLEIIPDVRAAHVFSLIEQHYPTAKDKVVETVLHVLFENPDYPKADAKGKRKREEPQEERAVRPKIDYGNKDRVFDRGMWYTPLALEQLEAEFSDIPTAHIRQTFQEHNLLYAPTYLALLEQQRSNAPPYRAMARPRHKGKGKRVQKHEDELEKEMQWIREKLDEEEAKRAAKVEEELRLEEEGGIECGCCFSEYPFDKMVQCPEAHLFCTTCMMSYAETKLGEHDAQIVCMDQSGCKLPFPDSELRRFLSPKLLELYERVKQRKEIEAAGLEGLEECPFCEYKVVIENENERLFRCENEACGAVTCRQCKKLDHLPKGCQAEVDDDKKLGVRHAIEEAMTAALMRNCPKCNKAFIKEMGCNKMTCPNCRTLSCYICRKVIVGYDHFAQPPPYTGRADPKKCTLWDASVEGRHSDEVTAAAKRALEEYKRTHPEFDEKDIAVDLPPPPPAGPSHPAHPHGRGALPVPQVHIPVPPPRLPGFAARRGRGLALPARHDPFGMAGVNLNLAGDLAAAPHARRPRRQPAQVIEHQHQHHHAAPVFNVQVHINPPPVQAGPAYPAPMPPQAPVFQPPPNIPPMPLPIPGMARAPPPPPRRSARKRAGR
ncbi:hypothetical protein OH76DRAFT_1363022 [Lentinus brumalis]|uniref:RING-type domain-containing protein n=1 Tax=Lentinus brumalis TaxID=2498619 RepID=A0A371CPV6_9APHY|nr:hypothetical protein OH76DRAFT_1363022 [Polyporus brumalis]